MWFNGIKCKTAKNFIKGSQEQKICTVLGPKYKSAIWDRTPSTYTSNLIYMCAEGFRGHKSSNRIEISQWMCVKHDNFMQMAAPIGEIPGNSL